MAKEPINIVISYSFSGIEPVPDRKRQPTWKTFLKAHWDCLAAIDFTTIEVWTKGGLVTYYLLFVMELSTRRVHLAAIPQSSDEKHKQGGNIGQHGQEIGGYAQRLKQILDDEYTAEQEGADHCPHRVP